MTNTTNAKPAEQQEREAFEAHMDATQPTHWRTEAHARDAWGYWHAAWQARAALAAQPQAAQAAPHGWKLVPVEPTAEMISAAQGDAILDGAMKKLFRQGLLKNWADMLAAAPSAPNAAPIDMVLHCPACGLQHIDAVEDLPMPMPGSAFEGSAGWTNPPHRSHLCHGCEHIWRPADVPTNGVAAVQTKGKADSPIAAPSAPAGQQAEPAPTGRSTTAQIHESGDNLLRATILAWEQNEYELHADRADADDDWYIQVTAPSGSYCYDGWWKDSAHKTRAEVLVEAVHGSCIGDGSIEQAEPAAQVQAADGTPWQQGYAFGRQRNEVDTENAERYLLLRRGQHWSVIDGIGNTLRAEALDTAVDAARAAQKGG